MAVLNPNQATEAELAALPGSSPALAAIIIAGRPYATATALDETSAVQLDAGARGALYELLFLPINLNTASAADIRLIPGMTRKMVHEFEEYRPYSSLEQFRREIGKYVDAAEVARLERCVTLGSD